MNRIHTRQLVTLAVLSLSAGCSAPEQTASKSPAQIAAYLDHLEAFGFSGHVAIADSMALLVSNSYGYADRIAGTKLHPDVTIAIASLSKQFTATAVLCLVDDQLIELEDSLVTLLQGVPPDKHGITIHQLLTHTSGLPRDAFRQVVVDSTDSLVSLVMATELQSTPGTKYNYSNAGYQLLAAVVDLKSERPYEEFCRSRLFKPANMVHTGFIHDAPPRVGAFNEWREVGTWSDWPRGWKHRGTGDVTSTANDLVAWWNALRFGRIISPALVRRMLTPHVEIRDHVHYGYGWEIRRPPDGDRLIVHGGDNRGFHSELRFNADREQLAVIVTHLSLYDESGWWLGLHKRVMAHNLLGMLRGDSLSLPPAVSQLSPENQERFTGRYDLPAGNFIRVWPAGNVLWVGADGPYAVNLLLPLDTTKTTQRIAFGRKAIGVLAWIQSLASGNSEQSTPLKPNEVAFFGEGMREEWLGWIKTHGPLRSMRVVGSVPLPWDPNLIRTQSELVFGNDTLDYHFTWNGSDLYETISEIGRPYPLILPIARVDDSTLATFDQVTEHTIRLGIQADSTGTLTGLQIGKVTAWRQ